jgi:hypothetical protein
MISEHDYEYIVVTLTPEEEKLVERAINIIYYGLSSILIIAGLIWLSQKPFKK